jgi:hypothetical protein
MEAIIAAAAAKKMGKRLVNKVNKRSPQIRCDELAPGGCHSTPYRSSSVR